jgi:hypothetical protein
VSKNIHIRFSNFDEVKALVGILFSACNKGISIFETDTKRDKIAFIDQFVVLMRRESRTSWVAIIGASGLNERYKTGYKCLQHKNVDGDIVWGSLVEADFVD